LQPMKERGGKKSPHTWQGLVLSRVIVATRPRSGATMARVGHRKGKAPVEKGDDRGKVGIRNRKARRNTRCQQQSDCKIPLL